MTIHKSQALTTSPINQLHPDEQRWFAVYTNYKREKLVQRLLTQKGITSYLPLLHRVRRYGNRRRTVELPLISCYIFVHINKSEYVPVLDTQDVLRFVRFRHDLIAIPDEELNLMRRVVGESGTHHVDVAASEWQPGTPVEIIAGELTGLRGRLNTQKNRNVLVVDLETLGYELRIEINPADLRPLDHWESMV